MEQDFKKSKPITSFGVVLDPFIDQHASRAVQGKANIVYIDSIAIFERARAVEKLTADIHEQNAFKFFKTSKWEPEPTPGKVIQGRQSSEFERRRKQAQESKTADKLPKWLKVRK